MADRKTALGNLPDRQPPLRNRAGIGVTSDFPPRGTALGQRPPGQPSNAMFWLWLCSGAALLVIVLALAYFYYSEGGVSVRRRAVLHEQTSNGIDSAEGVNVPHMEGEERAPWAGVTAAEAEPSAPQETQNHGKPTAEPATPRDAQLRPRVAARDPFETFPDAIELPVPIGRQAVSTDSQEQALELGELQDSTDEAMEIDLAEGAASLGEGLRFHIANAEGLDSRWEIRLIEDQPSGENLLVRRTPEDPVASIFVESGSLRFVWGAGSRHPNAEQLRNCALQLASGGYSHELRFRPIQRLDPFVLDISVGSFDAPLEGRALPAIGALYLRLSNHVGFPGQWEVLPPEGRAGSGEEVSISSLGKPQIELVAAVTLLQDRPTVRIRCFYRHEERRRALIQDTFASQLTRTAASLLRNRRDLGNYQAALPEVRRALADARAWTPRNHQEQQRRAGLIDRLVRQEIKCVNGVRRLGQTIPKSEEALAELRAIAQVANQLHERATIEFEVGVAGPDGDFPLLIATDGSAPAYQSTVNRP